MTDLGDAVRMNAVGVVVAALLLFGVVVSGFSAEISTILSIVGFATLSVSKSFAITDSQINEVRRRIKRLGGANVYRAKGHQDSDCPCCGEAMTGREVANFLSNGDGAIFGNRYSKWLHFECGIRNGFAIGAYRSHKASKTPSEETGKVISYLHLYFGLQELLDFLSLADRAHSWNQPASSDAFYSAEARREMQSFNSNSVILAQPKVEPTPQPKVVEPKTQPKVAKSSTVGGAEGQLVELIQSIAGKAIDEETVRRIAHETASGVIEQFSKSFAPVRTLEVIKGQQIVAKSGSVYHPHFPTALGIMTAGLATRGFPNPVLMTGDAGTGKSYAAQMFHALLQEVGLLSKEQDFKEVICFADMEKGDLIGRVKYSLNSDNEWNMSGLTTVLINGGVAFVDELDKADPAVATLLNGVLASRQLVNPVTGEVIPVSKDCYIVAAANTTGFAKSPRFAAAQKQDASLLDRFAGGFVSFGHSNRIMAHICGLSNAGKVEAEESPAGEPATPQEVFDSFNELKDLADSTRMGIPMSYRALEVGMSLAHSGWTMPSIVARWIVAFNEEAKRQVVANRIGGLNSWEESASLIPAGVEPITTPIGGAV